VQSQVRLDRGGAFAHADEPAPAVARGTGCRETAAVVADPEPQPTSVGDLHSHELGPPVPRGVRDRLRGDQHQRVTCTRGSVGAGFDVEQDTRALALGDLADGVRERAIERLVGVAAERRDRAPRLRHGPLRARARALDVPAALVDGAEIPKHAGKLLRDAVVQVACQPAALLERCGSGNTSPVVLQLGHRGDQHHQIEEESEGVPDVDVLREDRRVQEVVQPRRRGEHGRYRQPAQQRVVAARGAHREPHGRHGEEHRAERLRRHEQRFGVQVGPASIRRDRSGDHRRREIGLEQHGRRSDRDQQRRHRKAQPGGQVRARMQAAQRGQRRDREDPGPEQTADGRRPGGQDARVAGDDRRDRREAEVRHRQGAERERQEQVVDAAATPEAPERQVCGEQGDQRLAGDERHMQLRIAMGRLQCGDKLDEQRRRGGHGCHADDQGRGPDALHA